MKPNSPRANVEVILKAHVSMRSGKFNDILLAKLPFSFSEIDAPYEKGVVKVTGSYSLTRGLAGNR